MIAQRKRGAIKCHASGKVSSRHMHGLLRTCQLCADTHQQQKHKLGSYILSVRCHYLCLITNVETPSKVLLQLPCVDNILTAMAAALNNVPQHRLHSIYQSLYLCTCRIGLMLMTNKQSVQTHMGSEVGCYESQG